MEISLTFNGARFAADLSKPMHIGLPLLRDKNPGCYFTEPIEIRPIMAEGFIGSIADGGMVNHMRLSLAPHGNGTHTECSGHIYNNGLTLNKVIKEYHFPAQLISLLPQQSGDHCFITGEQLKNIRIQDGIRALVIRTLPNESAKQSKNYSGTNPPFISEAAMREIVASGIEHLVVDLPSVDPEVDEGKLVAHKAFWSERSRDEYCSITELAYIPNGISDGVYLLNLQILRLELDASPSNPVLYSLRSI